MKMQRRTFLASAAAAATAAQASTAMAAAPAGEFVGQKIDPWNQPKWLQDKFATAGKFIRQDVESRQDFTRGVSRWAARDGNRPEARAAQASLVRSKGIDPIGDSNLTDEQAFMILNEDPAYAARTRVNRSNFALHWENPRRAFFADAEYYLGEMEKTDKMGPGRLELNPNLDIPDWARHEIHSQPGGYCGDPFGGWVYHLGHVLGTDGITPGATSGSGRGRTVSFGQACRAPADRKVKRVLDIGCSMGDSTMGMKLRFPDAEVWGLDVGAPLLRYAHYQAVNAGMDINYTQQNAEKINFPDGHFDVVSSFIVFHEVAPESRQKIVNEIFRVLRPGGVYHHADFMTVGHPEYTPGSTIFGKAGRWVDHRHNVETWSPAYRDSDFYGVMRAAGFDVKFDGAPTEGSPGNGNFPHVSGIKPMRA